MSVITLDRGWQLKTHPKKPTPKNPKNPPNKTHKNDLFSFFYENNTNFSL
jgi:hypothetical protein